MKALAGWLANSVLLRRGRRVYELNEQEHFMVLSKLDKLLAGSFMILRDYAAGRFPPTFEDQAATYRGELGYRNRKGITTEQIRDSEVRKPFWDARATGGYLRNYVKLLRCLEKLDVKPPASLLELGCGTGWMAELLTLNRYEVLGTSLAESEIADALQRRQSLLAKQLDVKLDFLVAPMESVHERIPPGRSFDAIYIFEALHHAYSWERTIESAYRVLRPGGWLLLCNEPNLIHTFVSYRVGRLANTHEIGLDRRRLMLHMRQAGFRNLRVFGARMHAFVRAHWLAGQR
jgi:SAM-dependent methyltransferase